MPELTAATVAPMISALEGSVTRPVTEAFVDWAQRTGENEERNSTRRVETRIISPQGNAEAVSVLAARQGVNTQKGRLVTLKGVASLHLKRGMRVAPPLR